VSRGGESPEEVRDRARERRNEPGLGLGQGKLFLKTDYGRTNSLQCMSGAHRTAYSSCPVNHQTTHRKEESYARAAGAPDIAQCSVRCTPDCPVSPDKGNFEIFKIFYLVFNQT
jgi:hypothetical protein